MAAAGEELLQVLQQLMAREGETNSVCESVGEGLQLFCQCYHDQRNFTNTPHHSIFKKLLLATREWLIASWPLPHSPDTSKESECTSREACPVDEGTLHGGLMTVRLLLRDVEMQHVLLSHGHTLPTLTQFLSQMVNLHFSGPGGHTLPDDHTLPSHTFSVDLLKELTSEKSHTLPDDHTLPSHTFSVDLLKELTNIFQKISNTTKYREQLMKCEVHAHLVKLLWSHDLVCLQCSLCALINLCKTSGVCVGVARLPVAMPLLHIISSYDTISRHLAADLLLLLSQQSSFKQQVQDCDSLPACLSILRSEDLHLLHRMVGVVEGLAETTYFQEELRQLGGIPLLLNILKQKVLSEECTERAQIVALRAVCCGALTRLLLDDHNAQLIAQGNGVFLIATNILPIHHKIATRLQENLQCHALRALRYLFSMERNRRVFKKLFPPDLFTSFIDVGHYNSRLSSYSKLVHTINAFSETQLSEMTANIQSVNQDHAPLFSLAGYVVMDLLGAGSFGSVYKVRKEGSDVLYALKEIRGSHPCLGQTLGERSTSLKRLFNEVDITRQQLRHPNIVLYHRCFQEGDHLYIVMELLEGAPLIDYVASMDEKGSRFSEDRLWHLFIQLLQALRYLHKDKKIIHRDLSPANIMLNEQDKLTITDFGLAKMKQREFSVMKSVVGTMLYWCPELVESEPYTETADVWAAGCILYQMAMLRPPFQSSNLLALAKKIVEVTYDPIPPDSYSPLVSEVISSCLTSDTKLRPDTVKLAGQLSNVLMSHMDLLSSSKETLEKKLYKEKQRTAKHYHKALSSERRYHQLLSASSITEDHAPQDHTPNGHAHLPPSNTAPHVCRQLSGAFTSAQQQYSQPPNNNPNPPITTFPLGEDFEDPLQCSSCGSVFASEDREEEKRVEFGEVRDMPDRDREACHTLTYSDHQAASPLVVIRGRVNPTPQTLPPSHVRKQSSGEASSPFLSNVRQLPRRTSAPARTPSWNSGPLNYHGNTAPLSPLAAGRKSRTPSASSTVSISPKHLREVTDPILSLLTPLHKLLYLTQLPPSPTHSARRTLVMQYKRYLFGGKGSPPELKSELHQLASGSADTLHMFDGNGRGHQGGGAHLVQQALKEMREVGVADHLTQQDAISYGMMLQIIESLIVESGYYGNAGAQKAR